MEDNSTRPSLSRRLETALSGLEVGSPSLHRNLAVFPLTAPPAAGKGPAYFSLEEAIEEGGFRITELSESGSVPELRATNDCDRPVLLVDGEQLVGAKQNRIINITVLVPAKSETVIPVSCIEAGRWAHHGSDLAFEAAPEAYFAEGRRDKARQVSESMARGSGRFSDQGMVWDAVAAKSARMSAHSATSDLRAVYHRHRGNIEDYVSAISAADGQSGAIFAIDGHPVGIELFDHSAPFGRLFGKLVRSYALDAIESHRPVESAPGISPTLAFIESVTAAEPRAYPALGLGQDIRLESDEIDGGALLHEDRFVHLCAFGRSRVEDESERRGSGPTIQRASERQRRRRHNRTLH